MTPKEKANELVGRYDALANESIGCAKICVNEIIIAILEAEWSDCTYYRDSALQYWNKVKQEINNL